MGDLRWGFFYYRRGRKRSFGWLGVPPRGWRASPPSINLRRAGFGLAEGKGTRGRAGPSISLRAGEPNCPA